MLLAFFLRRVAAYRSHSFFHPLLPSFRGIPFEVFSLDVETLGRFEIAAETEPVILPS